MSYDIDRKAVTKKAYRVTKKRGETALRVRVPGGKIEADLLAKVSDIASKYGNGKVHLTTRQGFEILGIPWSNIEACDNAVQTLIDGLAINQTTSRNGGYSAAGTRNVAACIGNEVCPKAQYNTTEFAKEIEKNIFPNSLHFKIALTGCMNDCQKVRMHDFGILGMCEPKFDENRCIGCEQCVKKCTKLSTKALEFKNTRPKRNHEKCIGCGECVLICPTQAWSRSATKYYRLAIMGRTGKKNPRLGEDWIIWVDKDSIIKIIMNTYDYVDEYIDKTLSKEHIGYIIDRTGFMEFKRWALKDVNLLDESVIKNNVYWSGINYNTTNFN
ncbi:MAG: sulfite reductase subunit C [Bacilli bacterium]